MNVRGEEPEALSGREGVVNGFDGSEADEIWGFDVDDVVVVEDVLI